MAPRKNKVGKKFNRLTVLEFIGRVSGGKALYKCQCDCGKYTEVRGDNLKHGGVKSCGCLRVEEGHKYGIKNRKFSKEDTSWRDLYDKYKRGAKVRNIEFKLSHEDVKHIGSQNCYICGNEPELRVGRKKFGVPIYANGIDRVDSRQGYTKTNIKPCCWICNRMKNDMTFQEFILHCKQIVAKASEE